MHANSSGKDGISGNQITELAFSFQGSRILLTAVELGLFTALGDVERSSSGIPGAP